MARLFGALANAGAQYNKGRFAREQYDAEQQKIARDEKRRAFEFGAMNDRLLEQARQAAEDRKEARVQSAMQNGWEEDRDAEAVRGASAALGAATGFQGAGAFAQSPDDAPYKNVVEGIPIEAKKVGSQYMSVGGRVLRKNRQRDENAIKADQASKLMAEFAMKRDVASQLNNEKADRRAELQAIINAGRPQPQQRRHGRYFTNPKTGQALWVDEGENPPDGFLLATGGSGGAAAKTASGEGKAQRTALEDVTAQYYAMASKGAVPSIGLSDAYLMTKLSDPTAGPMETTAARAMMAKAGPQAQQLANFLARLNAVVMPARGGKAITMNEVKVIMGGAMPVAGESEDMRRQRMDAIFEVVGPLLAAEDGDYYGAIDRVKQRAATYSGAKKAAGSVSFDAALQSIKR